MDACIVSFFMGNVSKDVVFAQQQVVEKFNPSGYIHYQVLTDHSHHDSLDLFMRENETSLKHDIVVTLDIDCIPLNDKGIDYLVERASRKVLAGPPQRANHIENDQHVCVSAVAMGLNAATYIELGRPSFAPTERGDVGEELTYLYEEQGWELEFLMPTSYDESPIECEFWRLKDGMPVYGRGTTYKDLFWHSFQITFPNQQEKFVRKCKEVFDA